MELRSVLAHSSSSDTRSGQDMHLRVHGLFDVRIADGFPWQNDWTDFLSDVVAVSGSVEAGHSSLAVSWEPALSPSAFRELHRGVLVERDSLLDSEYGAILEFPSDHEFRLRVDNQCLEWLAWGLHLASLPSETCFVHAAGVSRDGSAILFPSWGGVGKTGIVATLMRQDGWKTLGDDFVILAADGTVYGFPKPMVIYPYHREMLPEAFSLGLGPVAPTFLNRALGHLGPALKPALRRVPGALRFARRHNPQSTRVHPSRVFGLDRLARSAALQRVIWLERVPGIAKFQLSPTDDSIVDRIFGSTLSEFDPRCVFVSNVATGLGLLGFDRFYGAWRRTLVSGLRGCGKEILYLPADMPVPAVAEIVRQLTTEKS